MKLPHIYSLQNNQELIQRLAHVSKGRKALFNGDFQGAIREYYLALENSGHAEEKKYLSLRNAVSHQRLDSERTINELEANFGIRILKGRYLDAADPLVQRTIEAHARNLKVIVEDYLKSQIGKS